MDVVGALNSSVNTACMPSTPNILNSEPFRDESSWEGVMESQSHQR